MRRAAAVALLGQVAMGQFVFTNSSTTARSTTSSVITIGSTTVTGPGVSTVIPITSVTSDEVPPFTDEPPTDTVPVPDTTTSVPTDSTSTMVDSMTTDTTTDTATTSTTTSTDGMVTGTASPNPVNVGGFTLLGCFGSPSSFPTFDVVLSAEVMTIDRCVAACPAGKRYAALFGNDCLCGDFVDDVNEVRRPESECNIPCPGAPSQRCGGRNQPLIGKRQTPVLSSSLRFSIYIRLDSAGGTGVINTQTITTTLTTTVGTGISVVTTTVCPYCPDCVGPFCWKNPCRDGKCQNTPCHGEDCYKKLVCYAGWCSWDYPCYGKSCHRRLRWNKDHWKPEICDEKDNGRKVICKGKKCEYAECDDKCKNEKITCYGDKCTVDKCHGDECDKKYVCEDGSCEHKKCPYEDRGKKYTCKTGKCHEEKPCEKDCPKPEPPCSGDKCIVTITPPPVTQTLCSDDDCKTTVVTPAPVTQTPNPDDDDEPAGPKPTDDGEEEPRPTEGANPEPTEGVTPEPTEGAAPGPEGPAATGGPAPAPETTGAPAPGPAPGPGGEDGAGNGSGGNGAGEGGAGNGGGNGAGEDGAGHGSGEEANPTMGGHNGAEPSTVVTAGSSVSIASFGALAFSVVVGVAFLL